jgi:DNA-binding HxlR family transcriptional regulator
MDVFDERILSILKDGKPRVFNQLLYEVGFSHNTLKLHLKRLRSDGLLVREKTPSDTLGRPRFVYAVSVKLRKQISAILSDPPVELVHLPFTKLKHLCRFEKGGYCKEVRTDCSSRICPQIPKVKEKRPRYYHTTKHQ